MQKDDSTSRPIFILPKPGFKHDHNIRFLTPHSNGKRQIFSYSEKSSASTLGVKVENFKRDLRRFQMKSKLEERIAVAEKDEELIKGNQKASWSNISEDQRFGKQTLYPVAVVSSSDSLVDRSEHSKAFARPWSLPRTRQSTTSYQTVSTGQSSTLVSESRHERASNPETLNSIRDPSTDRGATLTNFFQVSKFNTAIPSGRISFFKGDRHERPSIPGKDKTGSTEIFRVTRGSILSSTDRVQFQQATNLSNNTGGKAIFIPYSLNMNIANTLPKYPDKAAQQSSQQKMELDVKMQQEPPPRQEEGNTLKTLSRFGIDLDIRKRQLEQANMYSKYVDGQPSSGNSPAQSGRQVFHTQESPGSQQRANELEPRRKLPREYVSGSESEEHVRLIGNRERRSFYTGSSSSDPRGLTATTPTTPDKSWSTKPSDFGDCSAGNEAFVSGRPTAIIRADRRDGGESEFDVKSGTLYKDIPIPNSTSRVNDCSCPECQPAYNAALRGESLYSGGGEKRSDSYSPQKQTSGQLGQKNVDVLVKSHDDYRQPAFKTQRIGSVGEPTDRPSFKRNLSSESSRSRDRTSYNENRSEIYYFPTNKDIRKSHTVLDGVSAESEIMEPSERTVPLNKNHPYIPYSEPNYALRGYLEASRSNRNYPESDYSYFNNPEVRYIHKASDGFQRIPWNTALGYGNRISEKRLNPPRLIGSNSRAIDTYRERSYEKGYSNMTHSYETTTPRARTPENCHGGEAVRPGFKKKSHVVVMYGYPRKQRLLEKGDYGPFIESVSYKIHEKIVCVEDQSDVAGRFITHGPNIQRSFPDQTDSLFGQSVTEGEAKVRS